MRVAVFCGGTYVYGLEVVALNLMRALQARGHEVFCLANAWNDGAFVRRLDAQRTPHAEVYFGKLTKSLRPRHLWWMANTLARWPGALRRTRAHLRRFDPDVVLLLNRDTALLAATAVRGYPCVFGVQELPEPSRWVRRQYGALDRWVDRWVGASHYIGEKLVACGVAPDRVRVVHDGVEAPAGERRGERAGPPVVGICGQVGPWKGHDDLVDALGLLAERGMAVECRVFGSGDPAYVRALAARATARGLNGSFHLSGFVQDQDEMFDVIDVLAVPSRFGEPFGLVAAEAGRRGLPVVASRRGGLPEIVVDGETGFVVEAEAPAALADRLERLLRSPELRRAMGEAGRRRVEERFTLGTMAAGYEAAFAEAIAAPR